ncbi:MAG TPA: H-NS family nucleoid-associated regulatory protein [Xanthobacteraceae bacterium]|jgi:DNA-binding protein H-NS|nr:H-NS family nucleoid-associated regulatory protein [Xanthobacteraceae bacterium]
MTNIDFGALQIDELSSIYEQVGNLLAQRVLDEKNKIEARLRRLSVLSVRRPRRVIPPKYQNPDNPAQTWTGRGRSPLWVTKLLMEGKTKEDLRLPALETAGK